MVTIHVGRKTISSLNFKLMILGNIFQGEIIDPRHCFVHAFDHKDFTDFVLMKGESLTAKYYGIINFYATFSDEDAIMFKLTFGLDHFS